MDAAEANSGETVTGGSANSGGDSPYAVLDCRGQRCPLPVITLARRLAELPVGAVLRVLSDDPAAAGDIPAWCRMRGQEFLGQTEVDSDQADEVAWAYDVRRAA